MSKRLARLNEQLKREISALVRASVRDPRVGLVTVTNVETAADLGSARVRVRLTGDDAERKESLAGLDAAAPFLRRELGQMLRIRHIPELRFMEDHSLEHSIRIERLISEVLPEGYDPDYGDEVQKEGAPGDASDTGSDAGNEEPEAENEESDA